MKTCKHKWEFIAETRDSYNDWCELCGAWKRIPSEGDGKPKIFHPSGEKK